MKHIKLTLSGKPATGKTTLLNQVVKWLKENGYTVNSNPLDGPHEIRVMAPHDKVASER